MTSSSFFSFQEACRLSTVLAVDGVSSRLRSRPVSSSTRPKSPSSASPSTRSEAMTSPLFGSCSVAWMRICEPARTKLPTRAVVACALRATDSTTGADIVRSSRWPESSSSW